MNEDGLSQAITQFVGGALQGGLGSGGPISLIGNTRRVGHRDDLSKPSSSPSPSPLPPLPQITWSMFV